MPTITAPSSVTTVMVNMTVDPGQQDGLVLAAQPVLPIMAKQPGFISATLHKSTDGRRVVQYLQWDSVASHEACLASPDFHVTAATNFMAFIEANNVEMNVQVFDIVNVTEA